MPTLNDHDDVSADEAEADLGLNENDPLPRYRKSIVAVLGALATLAGIYGIDVDPELIAAVTTLLTASLVWWVPNE
jgi:hypothetical protein